MKKTITLFAVLVSFQALAQDTITTEDMPSVNDTFRLSTTVDLWGTDPTLTGTNYNWDYSFLYWATQDPDTCVAVGTTPFTYQFFFNNIILYSQWKADFAIRGTDFNAAGVFTMTDVYDFYRKDATGYKNVGFGANINGIPASVRNNPVDLVYDLDAHYGDTYTSYSEYELSIPGVFTYGQKKWRDAEVDGWGTLTTPYGTFQTLRIKMIIDITDSLVVDSLGIDFVTPRPQEIQYHWLADEQDVPLLQVNTIGGFVTSMIYKDSANSPGLGVKDISLEDKLNVYPNPTNDQLNIDAGKHELKYLRIWDMQGKMVIQQNIKNNISRCAISMATLEAGYYRLEAITTKGERFTSPVVKN